MKKIMTIKKILLMFILSFFFSTAIASVENGPINKEGSMYRYGAMENKVNFQGSEIEAKDIGKILADIIEEQNSSIEKINDAMDVFKDRSGVKTFLVGSSVGVLKFQMVQIKDLLYRLNTLLETDGADRIQIDNQIAFMKEEQIRVEDFILEKENKFSLFGWFVNTI